MKHLSVVCLLIMDQESLQIKADDDNEKGRLTFPLHLSLLMIFRAYSLPVDLSTHSRTTAKFPSPKVLPTLYLSEMDTGTEGHSSTSSAEEEKRYEK